MIKFKSKTELMEHIKDLVDSRYLTLNWFRFNDSKSQSSTKFYTISFENFSEDSNEN